MRHVCISPFNTRCNIHHFSLPKQSSFLQMECFIIIVLQYFHSGRLWDVAHNEDRLRHRPSNVANEDNYWVYTIGINISFLAITFNTKPKSVFCYQYVELQSIDIFSPGLPLYWSRGNDSWGVASFMCISLYIIMESSSEFWIFSDWVVIGLDCIWTLTLFIICSFLSQPVLPCTSPVSAKRSCSPLNWST